MISQSVCVVPTVKPVTDSDAARFDTSLQKRATQVADPFEAFSMEEAIT